jgi:hypothetical protein
MRPLPHELYVLQEVKIPTLSHKSRQGWGHPSVFFLLVALRFLSTPVAIEHARFARGAGEAPAPTRTLSFQASLADAAYQVVFGRLSFCDGEDLEGRGLVVRAKN